jgi:glycine cleavage system regulatory protein
MAVDEGGPLMLSVSGTDRTGMIAHIARQTKQCGVNIRSSVANRLEEQFAGTFFIIDGDRQNLERFRHEIKSTELEPIPGKQILPAKLFDIRVEGKDRVGMLYHVSAKLQDHDINIVAMGLRTIPQIPIDDEESDDDPIDEDSLMTSERQAFIHLRVEIPQEQLDFLGSLKSYLSGIDSSWQTSVREWKPPRRSKRTNFPWPVSDN